MNFRRFVVAVLPFSLLGGCNFIQSKEEQCLHSARLEFKDPDSLAVVQNMGSRGQTNVAGDEFFWLRYKAKNSYGAFMSSNMACAKKDGKWTRDTYREGRAIDVLEISYMNENTARMNKQTAAMRACTTDSCKDALIKNDPEAHLSPDQRVDTRMKQGAERARESVFESLQPL